MKAYRWVRNYSKSLWRPIEELEIFVSPSRGLRRNSRNFSRYEFRERVEFANLKINVGGKNGDKSEVSAKTWNMSKISSYILMGSGTWKKSKLSHLWTWNMFLLPELEREFFSQVPEPVYRERTRNFIAPEPIYEVGGGELGIFLVL